MYGPFRDLGLDLRFAWRSVKRRPLYSFTVTATLALGLAAASVVFSLVDHLLLRPVPGVSDPAAAVEIGRSFHGRGFDTLSWPELEDLAGLDAFTAVSAVRDVQVSVREPGASAVSGSPQTRRRPAVVVSPSYFEVMGLAPARGRFFTAGEGDPNDPREVAVLSHDFWRCELGADPAVVGRALRINRLPFTVVGVAPEDFRGHDATAVPDLWLPTGALAHTSELEAGVVPGGEPGAGPGLDTRYRISNWLHVVARLAPDVTLRQADAAVAGLFADLKRQYPEVYEQKSARVLPLRSAPGGARSVAAWFLGFLLALTGILVAVSCANVSSLFLVRNAGRRRDLALRLAVGSGRARLVRQLLVEVVLLFVAGAALGFWLSLAATEALSAALPTLAELGMPRLELQPDLRVFGFTLAVALLAGLSTGVLPALQATRPDLVPALKEGTECHSVGRRGLRVGRMRRLFVSLQVALTLLLVVTASLLGRSLQASGGAKLTFRTEGISIASLDLASEGYAEEEGRELGRRFLERAAALPVVAHAALALDLPLDLSSHGTSVWLGAGEGEGHELGVEFNVVTPGYFAALGLPVRAGRGFGTGDGARTPPVALVSRTFATAAWPGATAGEVLGSRFRFGDPDAPWVEVVGIVDDVANQTFGEELDPMVYLPWAQRYEPGLILVVHAAGGGGPPAAAAARAAVDELRRLDPDLAVGPVRDLSTITDLSRTPQRVAAGIASSLGAVALLLAALGIYGSVAYTAVRRRREVGIRMALGAERRQILGAVLRRELAALLPALGVGVALALLAARALRGFLYGVGPADPLSLLFGVALLLAAVLTAALLPARRSVEIDPAEALRGS
jgi:predicted permease